MENVNNYKGIQVYKNRSNKELFSIRIKLSNNKKFFGKFVSNKKEENRDTHVLTSLFMSINITIK